MPISKNPFRHSLKKQVQDNLFLENRFVFFAARAADLGVESSIDKLKQDKKALEARLETEQDLNERSKIQDEIKRIDDEIEGLKAIEPTEAPSALMYGLQSNVQELDRQIGAEPRIDVKQELEAKKLACLESLEARQREIKDQITLEDALDQVNSDDVIIKSLDQRSFDQIHIDYLLSSDLAPFFDDQLRSQLKVAKDQITTQDFVKNTLRPQRERLIVESDTEWQTFKTDTDNQIQSLEAERDRLSKGLKTDPKKSESKARIAQIEQMIPHMKKQTENRSDWVHKRVLQKERQLAQASLLDNIPPEMLARTKQLIEEARFMRAEKIREYLRKRFEQLQEGLKQKRNIFGKSTVSGMEQDFREFKQLLIDQPQNDPKTLKSLAANIRIAERQLSMSAEEITTINENRPQIEAQVMRAHADMEALLAQFKPGEIERLQDHLRRQEAARLQALRDGKTNHAKTDYDEEKRVSLVFQTKINALEQLKLPDSELKQRFAEYGERLKRINEIEPEELEAIRQDLEALRPKLETLSNLDQSIEDALNPENDAGRRAHQTISELENARDIEEIKEVLERNLSSEHLDFVTPAEFEREYRKYTPEGFMVFYQKGDEWKIIVDQSALADPQNVIELKKQLTHELLHLEFEKDEKTRNRVRENMIESNPDWPKIRQAYINMAEAEGKSPPHGDVWEDDDILSELYAMQRDIGFTHVPGDDPKSVLNNLLAGQGLASMLGNVDEKLDDYGKGDEEATKILGASSGAAGGDLKPEGGAETSGSYDENKNKIDMFQRQIGELQASEFTSYVSGAGALLSAMNRFNKQTTSLNESFKSAEDNPILAGGIQSRIERIDKDLKTVRKALAEASSRIPNQTINPLRKLWNNTSFLSISDIVQTGVDLFEFIERRHNRRKSDHAARLGMALFQGTNMGRESRARSEKAEKEEVQEWQNRYDNMDAWELIGEIKGMRNMIDPSQDQLKAILRILAQKGRIDWRDENLWTVINKLQNAVHLTPGDPILLKDPPLMRQKLHTALGQIYDYDEFMSLERQNQSSYDSEIQKYIPSYDRMQDQLTERLDQLLQIHRRGGKVDPMEYESIIEYSITKGKSYAEQVMFHLMVGIVEGILTPDRGLGLDKHLNLWPATQWIYSKQPPLSRQDYQDYCDKYFPNAFKDGSLAGGNGHEFKNFYWTHIQNDMMTIQRVRKSVSERLWDHDWYRSIACLGDGNTAKRFLSGKSGQQETKDTGVENAYAGAVMWLEENAVKPETIDYRKHFARQAAWLAMCEGILDRTAYFRGEHDIYTRSNENMEQAVAREQGVTNHTNWQLRDNRNKVRNFLDMIDPNFFRLFRARTARTDQDKQTLGAQARQYLIQRFPDQREKWESFQHIDDIFENMDFIIKTMMNSSNMSDDQLKRIIIAQRTRPE
ncbi:hypothetical protein KJ742_06130 [Patescibacteria group bacterium]|nr:hypothetical protein [Patescibacteria group bacterium]MBU1683495.1 hypothetical protein [Patescibacteria group bacterium]MBU1935416.1 hypothetical protein [Patescibacteria group bacterium]